MALISGKAINRGGAVHFFEPDEPMTVSTAQDLRFNNDFAEKLLGRPFPLIHKRYRLPIHEGIEFFTNFPEGATLPASYAAVKYNNEGGTVADVTVSLDVVENQHFVEVEVNSNLRVHEEFVILALAGNGTDVLYVSSPFVNVRSTQPGLTEISYRSDRGLYKNFPYAFDEEDRVNRIFCLGSMSDYSYPEDKTVYNEVTTGRPRTVTALQNRSWTFETYYMDFWAHETIAVAFQHDVVYLNGNRVHSETAYEPNSRKNSDLSSGTITVYDSEFSERIRSC